MATDPRNINYPAHSDRDTNRPVEETPGKTDAPTEGDRRSGPSDQVKELDRAERRKN